MTESNKPRLTEEQVRAVNIKQCEHHRNAHDAYICDACLTRRINALLAELDATPAPESHPASAPADTSIELAEVRAALKEAEWWEHLVGAAEPNHVEGFDRECMYCQRIGMLRAREAELLARGGVKS